MVLESNLGYTELHDLLLRAGDRRWGAAGGCAAPSAKLPCCWDTRHDLLLRAGNRRRGCEPCSPRRAGRRHGTCTASAHAPLFLKLSIPTPGRCSKIAPEEAQRVLKDMVFSRRLAEGCEDRSDTMKMVRCCACCAC